VDCPYREAYKLRGVVAQHATASMRAVARSPDHAGGPTEGLPLISPEETFGRRRGTVGRPRYSAVEFVTRGVFLIGGATHDLPQWILAFQARRAYHRVTDP
jgi:hypothetical protein